MRPRLWLALAAAIVVLVCAAAVIAAVRADSYQPVSWDGSTGSLNLSYSALPAGHGIRPVDAADPFDASHQGYYVPPQRGIFWLLTEIANNGSHAVIITSAAVPRGGPLRASGKARHVVTPLGGNGANAIPPVSRPLRHFWLRPGGELLVLIPVRTWPCGRQYRWASVPALDVTYQFGPFTDTAAVGWGPDGGPLIMHAPVRAPGQHTICARR